MKNYNTISFKILAVSIAGCLTACSPAQFDELKQQDTNVTSNSNNIEFGEFLKMDTASQMEIVEHHGYRCDGGSLPPVLPGPIQPLPYPEVSDNWPTPVERDIALTSTNSESGISYEEETSNNRPKYCLPICRVTYYSGTGVAEPIRNEEMAVSSTGTNDEFITGENYVVSSDNLGNYHRDYYDNSRKYLIGWCNEVIEPPVLCPNCEVKPPIGIPLPEPIPLPYPTPTPTPLPIELLSNDK